MYPAPPVTTTRGRGDWGAGNRVETRYVGGD
jgi:hypothetical protein